MKVSAEVRFAIIPEWLIFADVSDKAIRLYAVLARHANAEGETTVYRTTLAKEMCCSSDSVDRALRELVAIEALSVRSRRSEEHPRQQLANEYTLRTSAPSRTDAETPLRIGAARGSRTDAAVVNESKPERKKPERERDPAFDALVESTGNDPSKLTRKAARSAGVALAEIAEVHPDLNRLELAEEIRGGAVKYVRSHPDWALTPMALAKHWASLDGSGSTRPMSRHEANEMWNEMADALERGDL